MSLAATLPSLALLAGAVLGILVPEDPPYAAVLWVSLLTSAVAALWACWTTRPGAITFVVTVGFFAGGVLLASGAWMRASRPPLRRVFEARLAAGLGGGGGRGRPPSPDDSVPVEITGALSSDASPSPSGVSLDVEVQAVDRLPRGLGTAASGCRSGDAVAATCATAGGVLLTVVGDLGRIRLDDWRAGRTIRAPTLLRRPGQYLDPGVPDQARLLARRGVTLVGTIKSGALVELVARGSAMDEAASATRAFARRALAASVGRWGARAVAIVAAIVIGDRTGLDADAQRRLQEAGTYHVIAISGGNIAILAGLALVVFRVAGVLGRVAMLTASAALVAYAVLVGGGASVDRATLMAVIVCLGRALDLRGPPLNTLTVVAALLVAADPLAVVDPAFVLTFGATTAILAFAPPLGRGRGRSWLWREATGLLAASLAAEAALLPVGAWVFSRITVAGLALNFVAIPLMAVAQIAGMAVVPLFLVSARLASVAGWIAGCGAEGLVRSADLVGWAPALTWRVAPPSVWVVVGYYAGGLAAWSVWRRDRGAGAWLASRWPTGSAWLRGTSAAITTCAALWIAAEPWRVVSRRGDGRLHATFLDVGQGDAALVRFPHGAAFVVDAGGTAGQSTFDIGDRVVAPVLRQAGIGRLAVLALTHGDRDHIGGAPALVAEFQPQEVWEGIPVPPFEPLQALRAAATRVGARWTRTQTGDVTFVDDVAVVVRHPAPPEWERQKVRNDDSIVLELLWRDVSIVLAGDIGLETERAIAGTFEPSRLRVLKVPHHGSLTSSGVAFIRALAPRLAVVSAGRGNPFGHPVLEVLARYRAAGVEVYRTDQDGAVTVDTDGGSLAVSTVTGRRASLSPAATPLPARPATGPPSGGPTP